MMMERELLDKQCKQLDKICDVIASKIEVMASDYTSADDALSLVAAADRLEDLMRGVRERGSAVCTQAIEPKDIGFVDPDDICRIERLKCVENAPATYQLVLSKTVFDNLRHWSSGNVSLLVDEACNILIKPDGDDIELTREISLHEHKTLFSDQLGEDGDCDAVMMNGSHMVVIVPRDVYC